MMKLKVIMILQKDDAEVFKKEATSEDDLECCINGSLAHASTMYKILVNKIKEQQA